MYKRILVTGGAGFMGSAFIRTLFKQKIPFEKLVNLDLLTYAGNLKNVAMVADDPRYLFVHGNILDGALVEKLCRTYAIDAIVHFAAESHVDRSIADPSLFYRTNVGGTVTLLETVRHFPSIRFHHISTDEVYGSIEAGHCDEQAPYRPNSPYAASKAAADHFVRAYGNTYGLFITISHSTNNYGPYQAEEKFIPRLIRSCIDQQPLPIYGKGINVRDWLYVDDHADAVWKILTTGQAQETYNIGGNAEYRNIDLAYLIIEKFLAVARKEARPFSSSIEFVKDRPGHDLR
ncbi:MAG TPA: dTDP-glucose 4,6-dehydratase, partial [Rhabdochlamydiaceae bacterium]|nr:dTDP-glucose 4,6-dehydratase [Rhabdochlamydiaceae bacterium]